MGATQEAIELAKSSQAASLIVPIHDFFQITLIPSQGSVMAYVRCLECGEMVVHKDENIFACETCDIEVYRDELFLLATDSKVALDRLVRHIEVVGIPQKRRIEWGLVKFLRSLIRKVSSVFFKGTASK